MENEKTLRDEIAMSMPEGTIPVVQNKETRDVVSQYYRLEWSDDPLVQIEWAIKYQTIIRYKYADAMLKGRRHYW